MVTLDKNKNFAGDHTDRIKSLGYKVMRDDGSYDYIFIPSSFKDTLCKGYNSRQLAHALQKRKLLIPANDGKPYRNERLPDVGTAKIYYIKSEILSYEPSLLSMK
jgi:putative DNA primase/helicase